MRRRKYMYIALGIGVTIVAILILLFSICGITFDKCGAGDWATHQQTNNIERLLRVLIYITILNFSLNLHFNKLLIKNFN